MDHYTPDTPAVKVCTKCGESKALSEFTQRKTGKQAGRYESRCRLCMRAASSDYRARHPDRVAASRVVAGDKYRDERNAAYRERLATDSEYRKKRNDKSRRWRQSHRSRIAEYNATRYIEQPEIMRAAVKASMEKHPEHHAARKAVAWAVKSGKFPPAWTMVCDGCYEALASHWHHHKGYADEYKLDVIALCTECHGKAHWVD